MHEIESPAPFHRRREKIGGAELDAFAGKTLARPIDRARDQIESGHARAASWPVKSASASGRIEASASSSRFCGVTRRRGGVVKGGCSKRLYAGRCEDFRSVLVWPGPEKTHVNRISSQYEYMALDDFEEL